MVIFHSYVSLPEGSSVNIGPFHVCLRLPIFPMTSGNMWQWIGDVHSRLSDTPEFTMHWFNHWRAWIVKSQCWLVSGLHFWYLLIKAREQVPQWISKGRFLAKDESPVLLLRPVDRKIWEMERSWLFWDELHLFGCFGRGGSSSSAKNPPNIRGWGSWPAQLGASCDKIFVLP